VCASAFEMTTQDSLPSRKRIIALFTDVLPIGGVQLAGRLTTAALAEIASAHGWAVDVISLNDPPGTHAVPGSPAGLCVKGFGRAKVRFVSSALKRAWETKDGVILAGHPHLAQPASWMRRVRTSLKLLVMSHGIEVWKPLPAARKKALQRADMVLAPSSYTAGRLTEIQGIPQAKVARLPFPINPGFLQMMKSAPSLPLPQGFPNGRVVLAVGRWAANERYKGVDQLIRAVAELRATIPEVQLVAIGGGDDLPRLRELAGELKVRDRVHFLENLANEEVAACYANCEIFGLPSTGEGFGMVFLEAMAFGKPVVAAACGGPTDIVRNGANGVLVPPCDAIALTQSLKQLLDDPSLRARMGLCAIETVKREYSFDVFRENLEKILSGLGR
jgi:phosphatidyl-myo-inositol dimannoside synthase